MKELELAFSSQLKKSIFVHKFFLPDKILEDQRELRMYYMTISIL